MERRVLYIVLLLVVGLFLFVGYNSYDTRRGPAGGKADSKDPATVVVKTEPVVTSSATEPAAALPTSLPAAPAAVETAPAAAQITQNSAPQTKGGVSSGELKPPSGMMFSGVGRYQLYRQGDITWRLDTETGKTCIVFATDEEWTKPRVYRNGCAKR